MPLLNQKSWDLPNGYEIKRIEHDEFWPLFQEHIPSLFPDAPVVFLPHIISEQEMKKMKSTRPSERPFSLALVIYKGDELIGWHYGNHSTAEKYYMMNSAIYPDHRKQGLYTKLIELSCEIATEMGYQTIESHHTLTNNPVIIAKLKHGFHIAGVEVSDAFGTLVKLAYYPNQRRKKLLDYRVGAIGLDEDLKKVFEDAAGGSP